MARLQRSPRIAVSMLILTRLRGEAIRIGEDILIHVLSIEPGRVKLGIDAPQHVSIWREEIGFDDDLSGVSSTEKKT